ncbi:MAG: MFS transporter [Burkholderiaceae bacterium]
MRRNLILLALCQGLFLTNNVLFLAVNGLVGLTMAPMGWLATLPIMAYVVGGAASTGLVAKTQKQLGRKRSFELGIWVAILSAALCVVAVWYRQFWLLVFATFVAGFYQANGQLYRFAAAELASPELRDKAVSWVLAGGLLGAVAGPNLASYTKDMFEVDFAGSYLSLTLVGLLALLLMHRIQFSDDAKSAKTQDATDPATQQPKAQGLASDTTAKQEPINRPLADIMRQPVFLVSVLGASFGYGVMNLLMAATPLAMQVCGMPFSDAAFVLEWHVIGMFAPGFFTGHLIQRFGAVRVMLAGVFLNLVCIGIALSGTELYQFTLALFVLGVGWNFLFTASTSFSLQAYHPAERDKAQGAINFWVFFVMGLSSLGSGALVTSQGWQILNMVSVLPMMVLLIALLIYFLKYKPQTAS